MTNSAPPDADMRTVASRDGTRIAYCRSGAGPPLLLVHGATADHSTTWRLVTPLLNRHFTVCAMDRRGRGGSADGPRYAIDREVDDIASVAADVGGEIDVLAHSFGALCTLEAALVLPNLRRLILYEPPLGREKIPPVETLDRLDGLLTAGEVEQVLIEFYRTIALIPEHEIDMLRSQEAAWRTRLANAATIPREMRALAGYQFRPERFSQLDIPALLLLGSNSPPQDRATTETLAGVLPQSRVRVFEGQQHLAMYTVPEQFVQVVADFLE